MRDFLSACGGDYPANPELSGHPANSDNRWWRPIRRLSPQSLDINRLQIM